MKLAQKIVTYFIFKPLFKIFFNFKVLDSKQAHNLSGPLLIIANHKFFLDSFAFGVALPFSTNLFPVRFMGATKDFQDPSIRLLKKIGLIKLVYGIFGVFPAVRGKDLKEALKIPAEIIKKGGVVFLHPEGEMIHEDGISQFKRGAPALALMTDVKILPVAFKKNKNGYFIKFGSVFNLPQNLSVEGGAEYMRSIIFGLYESI